MMVYSNALVYNESLQQCFLYNSMSLRRWGIPIIKCLSLANNSVLSRFIIIKSMVPTLLQFHTLLSWFQNHYKNKPSLQAKDIQNKAQTKHSYYIRN